MAVNAASPAATYAAFVYTASLLCLRLVLTCFALDQDVTESTLHGQPG
jgi:hypothetical protein